MSSDGRWVVYETIFNQLVSVPIEGGVWHQLGPPPGESSVGGALLSRDLPYVVYRASTAFSDSLWAVPIDGTADDAVELSGESLNPGGVYEVWLTPDGSRALYTSSEDRLNYFDLYSVPVDGSAADRVRVSLNLDDNRSAWQATFSPDSSRVAYLVRAIAVEPSELWSSPVDVPDPTRLSQPAAPGTYGPTPCEFTPDGSLCVYDGDMKAPDYQELFSSPVPGTGGSSTRISADLPPNGTVSPVFRIAPDGTRVVYEMYLSVYNGGNEILSTPVGGPGSEAVSLSAGVLPGSSPSAAWETFTPDSEFVVFQAGTMEENAALFIVPANGPSSAAMRLTPPIPGNAHIYGFLLSLDASEAIYPLQYDNTDGPGFCYRVPLDGSEAPSPLWLVPQHFESPTKTCVPRPGADDVLAWSKPSLDHVAAYLTLSHLHGPPDQTPLTLTDPDLLSDFYGVQDDWKITSDGAWVVFRGRPPDGSGYRLWARRLPLFWDSFESGSTDRWSSVEP